MQKVKILKPTPGYRVGDVVVVSNNVAFGLIDSGKAKIYCPRPKRKKTKEMRAKLSSKKGYITK